MAAKKRDKIYITAKNPVWSNKDKTAITLTVDFKQHGELLFTATEYDVEDHGREIFSEAKLGKFGDIGEFVPKAKKPPTEQEVLMEAMRGKLTNEEIEAARLKLAEE